MDVLCKPLPLSCSKQAAFAFISISIWTTFFFLVSHPVHAQRNGFGLKAGLNFASLYDTPEFIDAQIVGSRITYHVGIFARLPLSFSDEIYIQPELLLSHKGTRGLPIDPTTNSRLLLPYASVPLLLSYQPFTVLSLQLGPEFAYRLAANAKIGNEKQELEDFYRDVDLGLILGLAYHSPGGLHIGARMNVGLIHFWRLDGFNTSGTSGIIRAGKHQVFQLSLGYILIRQR